MYLALKFLHLSAAIAWLGGMTFVLFALRPAAAQLLEPPQRLALLGGALKRFFVLVWASIALILVSGFYMLLTVGFSAAPPSWHTMMGVGLLMCLVFAHIYSAPFRRFQHALGVSDWPAAGRQAGLIAKLVMLNFALGWIAVAAISLTR